MMKFVMRGSNKVAPLSVPQREGLSALYDDEKKMPLRDESFLSEGGFTAETTDQSLSSKSSQSLASLSDEELEKEENTIKTRIGEDKEEETESTSLPKLVKVPEDKPLLPENNVPSPASAAPKEVKQVSAPPSRPSLPPPRPRHRRTSSAMPRLETLHEGRATIPAEKPPLPPRRFGSPPSSDVGSSSRHRRGNSFSGVSTVVNNYPSASPTSGTPKPQRIHRRTYSAPPKQPEDFLTVTSLQQQLKQLQQQYGEEHAMVATTWNWLGNAYFRQGNMEAALQAYKKAVLCEPGEHLADAYANMGTVHWATGNVEEAIPFLQNALSVHEYNVMSSGQDPNTSLPVGAVQYQLGLALTLHKDYEAALHALNQARVIRERVLGHNHMDVARTLDAMGKACSLKGDFPQALKCHLHSLRIKEAISKDAGRSVMFTTISSIAGVYRSLQNLAEAGIWMHRLLKEQKNEFLALKTKAVCADIGTTLTTLGEIYDSATQYSEANTCYREADMYFAKARIPEEDPRRVFLQQRMQA